MDVREKLVGIVERASVRTLPKNTCHTNIVMLVNALIEEGVTVQEWVSVKDRLPNGKKIIDGEEYIKNVAVRVKDDACEKIAYYDDEEKCWFDTEFFPVAGEVTHWCELPEWNLPQPPKGE